MIDVFTPKWISPDFPFKSNQRLTKISILSLGCAAWLPGVMRTAELDSTVGCTRWDAHRGAWLGSIMHTAELDSTVWCTPQSLTPQCDAHPGVFEKLGSLDSGVWCTPWSLTPQSQTTTKMSVFVFSNSWRLSTTFLSKNVLGQFVTFCIIFLVIF